MLHDRLTYSEVIVPGCHGFTNTVRIRRQASRVKDIAATVDVNSVTLADVESNIVRCPDPAAAEKMIRLIEQMRSQGDSVGGIVEGVARGVPAGWGEPVFDRLEADLAKAMLSLPASKGFEIGSGFGGIELTGTQHNDPYRMVGGKVRTTSNRSGGVQGGASRMAKQSISASPSNPWQPS